LKLTLVVAAAVLCSFAVAQPSIDNGGVLNVSSAQPTLAPNVVFVIYGKNLGPASIVTATAPNYPPSLLGVSVSFTLVGSNSPIVANLVYVLSNAVAGLLPSSTTPGTYAVRVTVGNQTSNAQNVTVVARHFGIATANGVGSGVAQATIANVNGGLALTRFTSNGTPGGTNFISAPAHINDTISLWGTGGGKDAANDTGGSSGDQTTTGNFKILIGAQTITPSYAAAAAPYPGLWVINFTIPNDPTLVGCFTTVQVSTGSEFSNAVTIPIAAAGQTACTDTTSGLTPAQLAKLDSGGVLKGAGFTVSKTASTVSFSAAGQTISQTSVAETISGSVGTFTAAQFAARFGQRNLPPCVIYDVTGNVNTISTGIATQAFLNAGATLPVSGPGLAGNAAMTLQNGLYNLTLPSGTLSAGTYNLTGNGGVDVGAFNASLQFPGSFAVTNFDTISTITRATPFTVSWTGGGTESVVVTIIGQATISGSTQDPANQTVHEVILSCRVPASSQTLTIPAGTMSQLPTVSGDVTAGGFAQISVVAASSGTTSNFTATLAAGGQLDYGYWLYNLGVSRNIAIN
jgi:uncharacterized protein (TIGR03437 family)